MPASKQKQKKILENLPGRADAAPTNVPDDMGEATAVEFKPCCERKRAGALTQNRSPDITSTICQRGAKAFCIH